MTFTLCMIVKNEETVVERCLDSVKELFDEIIVVDTGSADNTKEKVAAYTDKIYDFEWINDFSAARNFSFSKASGDYIMWLDADDVVSKENLDALINLKNTMSDKTDVVMMKYVTAFDENNNPTFCFYRERLVKRMANFKWNGFVHEAITPKGNVVYEDISVFHMPLVNKKKDNARNLKMYEEMLLKGAKLSARDSYYYARELFYNDKFQKAKGVFEEFLKNPGGRAADKSEACIMLYEICKNDNPQKAKEYLCLSFAYGDVSPLALCLMGDLFMKENNPGQSRFWYASALVCPVDYSFYGFSRVDYEGYYPYLQLCVCYDKMGEYQKAEECNRLAGQIKPGDPQVEYNNLYFKNIKKTIEK